MGPAGRGIALLGVLAVCATACGRETGGAARIAQVAPVQRQACAVDLPAQWKDAIAGSAVDIGGTTASPRAVGPGGEVVAVRSDGDVSDLVLVGTDRSVRELYALPEADVFVIGSVGIDDRWIVFSVVRHPRNANGVLPQPKRIEIIDRQTGSRRTVTEQSEADSAARPERNVLDDFSLSGGKVYWITRDGFNADTGVAHSFDPLTDRRTDIASGPVREIRSGPEWSALGAPLPAEVAGLPADDLASVGTDGTAFGWVTGPAVGGAGIGYWSPQTGVVQVNGVDVGDIRYLGRAMVFDSFVILDAGGSTTSTGAAATVVDTRSGAVVRLTPRSPGRYDRVIASLGGTLALALWAGDGRESKQPDHAVGLLRDNALSSPSC